MSKESDKNNFEVPRKRGHERVPVNPCFFACSGVSGAGVSTAVKQIETEGYVLFGPPQFTTRTFRPGEKIGDQYYSVKRETLARIPQQIVLQKHMSGNEYGIFIPAIISVRRKILQGSNIILDSVHSPAEWKRVLGEGIRVVSIFFAPKNPETAVQRIVHRAKQSSDPLLNQYLPARVKEDARYILQIRDYDYWIDTTNLGKVKQALLAVILQTSFNEESSSNVLYEVCSSGDKIEELIDRYVKQDE